MDDTKKIQMEFLDIKNVISKVKIMMIAISIYEVASYVKYLIFLHNNPLCQVDIFIITFSQKMKQIQKVKELVLGHRPSK